MPPESQVLLSIGIPTIAVLVAMLVNNRQLESLRSEMNARFEALDSKFQSIESRFEAVDAKLNSLAQVMNARFDAGHQALLRVEGVVDARLKHLEELR